MRPIGIPATVKLIYLLLLSLVLFMFEQPWLIAGLFLLQSLLWLSSRLSVRLMIPVAQRLGVFFFFIMIAYVFFPMPADANTEQIVWPVGPWALEISLTGFKIALLMSVRVWVLVMASLWVQRSSQQGDLVQAMVYLKTPRFLAVSLEATLELLTGGQEKGAHGKAAGKGAGKGRHKKTKLSIRFQQLRRGDLSFFFELIERSLRRTEKHLEKTAGLTAEQRRDVAIIAGISVAMMGLKLFQLMPGLPIAPGHKNLLMIPLFLLASSMTHSRFGGLWTGLTVGVVNFMLGFGKFGILEILQFIAPALLADMLVPLLRGSHGWRWFQLVFFGALLGLTRFIANFLVIVLAGAPLAAFMLYLPMLLSQIIFGMLSVVVASPLLIWAEQRKHAGAGYAEHSKTGKKGDNKDE